MLRILLLRHSILTDTGLLNNFSAKKIKGFPGGTVVKNLLNNEGDTGLIPGQGGNPGGRSGNQLQYSRLGSPMDRGAWWATVNGVTRVRHYLETKQQQKDQNCMLETRKQVLFSK